MKMSKSATREYIVRMQNRYARLENKVAKGHLLTEFCATTELDRKHAIRVLRRSNPPLLRVGRKATYGPRVAEALGRLWMEAGQPCSKLMRPVMLCYVRSYEGMYGRFKADVREQVMSVSASSIDRLLHEVRVKSPRRRRSPMGVAAVKKEVPIRAGIWTETEPGWIEADTVAHCGGRMDGNFVWSITMTDILTQWTEIRATWNRGAEGTIRRIKEVEHVLPFVLRGFDADNGPEFMNWHLLDYLRNRNVPVSFTRSRPYQKNDNAHVEQKNGTHVRGLLGHDRIEDPDCVEELNRALVMWSEWKNLYSPVMKLVSKVRKGHRYIKRYDQPQTPAQRVLACSSVDEESKEKIRQLLVTTDCFLAKRAVDAALRDVFSTMRHECEVGQDASFFPASVPSALRAAPSGSGTEAGKKPFLHYNPPKLQNRMVSSL